MKCCIFQLWISPDVELTSVRDAKFLKYHDTKFLRFRLHSNSSQILLLYKVWGYYNKFDSMKSLGLYHWYVKMPRLGCVEPGLDYFSFHFQKHITYLTTCSGQPAGSRRVARGARISGTRLFILKQYVIELHLTSVIIGSMQVTQLELEQCTVSVMTYLANRQSGWWRSGIRATNLHIAVELLVFPKGIMFW